MPTVLRGYDLNGPTLALVFPSGTSINKRTAHLLSFCGELSGQMKSSFENSDPSVDDTVKLLESEGLEGDWSFKSDGSNAIFLPGKKKSKTKNESKGEMKRQRIRLSNSQKRKLKKLQEEKEKKALELKSIRILEKYKIQDSTYSLLQSSGNMGQVETKGEKRRRAIQLSKAGLEMRHDDPPLKKRVSHAIFDQSEFAAEVDTDDDKSSSKQHLDDCSPQSIIVERDAISTHGIFDGHQMETCRQDTDPATPTTLTILEVDNNNTGKCTRWDQNTPAIASCNYVGGVKTVPQVHASKIVCQNVSYLDAHVDLKPANDRTVVHVSRPHEVESKRGDLPIVMMEQEIMEAINENSTVIICGETGCGKTTQVPQFLYEAGFASGKCNDRKGVIGVTQPRRVAVLATAKRVAFELGFHLGREVGFQVRHDKKIGENCSIKFMTDGILLREVQSDFLLKRYSIIILDEAHERSLNTDILIGMLSRIIQIRQKLYMEQQEKILSGMHISPENMVTELKLILMSATLRVEDFISDRRLFRDPPPVIEVPTRQFPVTVHFSRRTEIVDYMGQAYRKVMLIHKKLPPGGVLVFVTGQREVEYLCKKLRKASEQLIKNSSRKKLDDGFDLVAEEGCIDQGPDMKDINEAFGFQGHSHDQHADRLSSYDEEIDTHEKDSYSSESATDSELEIDSDSEDSSSLETMEKTDMVVDVLGNSESLASLKAAFEALTHKTSNTNHEETSHPLSPGMDGCVEKSPIDGKKCGVDGRCPGTLRVLPLYAMLPAAAQLRVFKDVCEGERLVVVATNVAETSLTIPGIKYVVDTGREKVKNYNCASGMASYEVQWISKASAAQRAGRAGRTSPGHCYRLYSSAVFNNFFLEYSSAEITKIPVDGVVLVMKFMGIDKVANFPFPTPPEATALVEAERCLKALEALDSKGRLTPIGKAMAQYPMSPRHSRMLLTVIQIMRSQQGYARANLVLGYTVAAAAALSFSSPFIMQFGGCNESTDNLGDGQGENSFKQAGICSEKILDRQEKQRQKKLKAAAKEARLKFCNPSSDALTIAYALQAFELAENSVEFCKNNALYLKTMDEMSKLRKQLLRLIFHQSAVGGLQQEFSWTHGNVEDVEHAWMTPIDKHPLLLVEEEILGQAICAGWADRVAMRIRRVSELPDKDKKANAVRYQSCTVNETVFLHRWSSVSQSAPEFLVYNELLQSKRPYMHGVTSVKSEWLVKYAKSLCSFSAPLTDPKPYYDPSMDQVLCWVSPTFGPHLWQLPLHSLPIKNDVLRVSTFAYSLLAGKVLPCMTSAKKFMAAPPDSILKPEAAGQRRVGNLLNKLKMGSSMIDSRNALRDAWNKNPQELHSEVLCWFQDKYHDFFEELWARMHHEVLLGAHELFPERVKRGRK